MNLNLRIGLAALFPLLLAACAIEPADEGPTPQRWNLPELVFTEDGRPDPSVLAPVQILHRGNGTQPEGLDPHLTESVSSSNVQRDLFEGLIARAADGSLIPGVAERWEVSGDGLVWTFFLREDARWSNADPMTAEDWLFSFRRIVNPATGSRFAILLTPILNAQDIIAGRRPVEDLGVRVIDELTLEVDMEAPNPFFLEVLTHSLALPVHRASIEAHGDRWARPGNMVSNGPFMLEELAMHSHIRLVRNPYYWDSDNVIIEEVFFYPTEDISAEMMRYRAGELSWTNQVPNTQFNWIQANLADELAVYDWLGIYYFGFNTTRAPFNDPRVTKALSLAIDREIITERLTGFGQRPAFAFTPQGIPGYDPPQPEWASWTQAERNLHARALLAEAGFGPHNPLRLEIRYNTHEDHRRISLAIAAMWQQTLGVYATLINEEFRVFLNNRRQRVVTEVFRSGWIGNYLDPMYFLELFFSDNPQNDVGFFNDEFDALLDRAARAADLEERLALLREAEILMLKTQPFAPIFTYVSVRLVKPYVRGWVPNVLDQHPTRFMFLLRQDSVQQGVD